MTVFAIRKPTAQDSSAIRKMLKSLGINIAVKKSAWSVNIGTQCQHLSKETAVTIFSALKSSGYLIGQEHIILNLIDKGVCDVITVKITA